MNKWVKIYFSGIFMGAADIVPGVSGGTIAFILGVYERLISALSGVNKESIQLLFNGDIKGLWKHFDASFLLVLGIGILTSLVALSGAISYALEFYPRYLASFFLGLILASAALLSKDLPKLQTKHLMMILFGCCFGVLVSLLSPTNINVTPLMIILSGMIAICAMLLPGISGSFILLMLGMYGPVLLAIKNLELNVLVLFASGALLGLLTFSKLLKYLMTYFREITISFLIGVMLGSLLKIWPWKNIGQWTNIDGKEVPENVMYVMPWNINDYQMSSDLVYPLCFVLLGIFIIKVINNIFLLNDTNDIDTKL
ncbi:DUF368 domain-containing protein [Marinomonas sp. PE14-40]|uniref:DUF368 domain-containing protein n=1 Tax=Marinomonas sp. PE14-40 TaxID=3060621 RepID=UPI003F6804BD